MRYCLLLLLLTGCFSTSSNKKELVHFVPVQVKMIRPSNVPYLAPRTNQFYSFVLTAYFTTGQASVGFFQSTTDLINWSMLCTFDYPIKGSQIRYTNNFTTNNTFFRAGYVP